jgi:hypothetical protein
MAGLAAAASCGGDTEDHAGDITTTGPLMRPGWNCLASGCHFPDKKPVPPDWGAAGTVFPGLDARATEGVPDVVVILRDGGGKEIRLVTNGVGNFYTAETFDGPIDVTLEREGRQIKMPTPAPAGSCNFCHSVPPTNEEGFPKGRIFAPLR